MDNDGAARIRIFLAVTVVVTRRRCALVIVIPAVC